ncbi:Lrp/AsnC family transcriptional regulator [Microbacterium fluvii]|uniref:Lrp/AsnC family transcriptional regulator n=1 Tax=Microbacterium fluvii TaxID=415215 RepID=A0ABW2HG96_9MICO|nr:Lrp/AsnC family transcriptional regulator [Microbacterium fluvii]MCU4673948.1 Lrp/AsnC family transcriptional regulator [Microbacterium fluvii]
MDPLLADDIDRRIIDQLRVDGRRSFGEIARNVGLSEVSVRSRYNRLRDLGVVQVVAMPDPIRMQQVECHLLIRVRDVGVEVVANHLAKHPEVKFIAATLGEFDLVVDVRFETNEALSQFLHTELRRIRGIDRVETSVVLENLKDSYLWEGFRERVGRRPPGEAGD